MKIELTRDELEKILAEKFNLEPYTTKISGFSSGSETYYSNGWDQERDMLQSITIETGDND